MQGNCLLVKEALTRIVEDRFVQWRAPESGRADVALRKHKDRSNVRQQGAIYSSFEISSECESCAAIAVTPTAQLHVRIGSVDQSEKLSSSGVFRQFERDQVVFVERRWNPIIVRAGYLVVIRFRIGEKRYRRTTIPFEQS